MGKEIKIGLVAIGVLLIIFGGLLVRRFAAANGEGAQISVARTVAAPPSNPGMIDKTAVVLAQAAAPESNGIWSTSGRDSRGDSDNPSDAPRRKLPPAGDAPADAADATHQLPVAQEPQLPAISNPFNVPGRSLSPAPETTSEPRAPERETLEGSSSDDQTNLPRLQEPEEATQADLSADTEQAIAEPANDNGVSAIDQDAPLEPAVAGGPESTVTRGQKPADESRQPAERETSDDMRWASPPARQAAGREETAPLPVSNGKYTVQPNDNLWVVSEKVYGTGGYFKALREQNRRVLQHADLLVVGSVLDVPPVGVLEKSFPTLCPKQRKSAVVKARALAAGTRGRRATGADMYVVAEGDTLFDIARYELGKASRWAEIFELNREVLGDDYDHLVPGTELAMPSRSQATDSVTQQPDSRYQR